MKLYVVNQLIEGIFEQLVDPETGEVVENEALLAQLESLQMERSRIMEHLAKLVLNTRAQMAALKEEEKRLKERRASLEQKDTRLMEILDRECGGEKTDCGVATVCYRKTTRVEVDDDATAVTWLIDNGHTQCYRVPAPEISKTEVKKLLAAGTEIPGVALVQDYSCSLR